MESKGSLSWLSTSAPAEPSPSDDDSPETSLFLPIDDELLDPKSFFSILSDENLPGSSAESWTEIRSIPWINTEDLIELDSHSFRKKTTPSEETKAADEAKGVSKSSEYINYLVKCTWGGYISSIVDKR
ncbi:hypothetical protein F3Y22_tig00112800pilonHSYRG00049 [Hibiscus syriacus]|uniref:Uncharacterized protein n=1 Tax=Hibiscus syriacus TaxID=106335 RepID=A0A6A2WTP9_HIBSY|nr:hypothetical protein F3Y22_tig00112800pilonHSYRG00049 [Hibiscus syriacus]